MSDKPILDNTNPTALEQFKQRVRTLCNESMQGQTVFDLHFLSRVVKEIELIEDPNNDIQEQIVTGGTFKEND
jgi:hypothetical protein